MEAIHAHQRNMPEAIQRALHDAKLAVTEVDGIAFTRGPGMSGCLRTCCDAAKALASALHKPLVGVHHMQAHALTPLFTLPESHKPTFPFLTLLISGGHTLLLVAHSPSQFNILATTPDSSIGNAYDKVSRLLELEWGTHGLGAALEKLCADHPSQMPQKGDDISFPLASRGKLLFSYSGLYAAVLRQVEGMSKKDMTLETKAKIAWAFQISAIGQLEEKVKLGFRWCESRGINVRHLVVSGGVASNLFLRERLKACLQMLKTPHEVQLAFPPVSLCTDNAAMIAWASMYRFLKNEHDSYDIIIQPNWSIEDLELERNQPALLI